MPRPLSFDPNDCPIRDVLDRLGDQWSLLVLATLEGRVWRFNELSREIEDISRQMLSKTLRRLEEDGFVRRTIYAEIPPRVEYELTGLGRSVLVPVKALIDWADAHHGDIRAARADFSLGSALGVHPVPPSARPGGGTPSVMICGRPREQGSTRAVTR